MDVYKTGQFEEDLEAVPVSHFYAIDVPSTLETSPRYPREIVGLELRKANESHKTVGLGCDMKLSGNLSV